MDNHYHLLIETPDGNLALGMRQLNGVYTQLFNKLHGGAGHLFQGRYKSILIQKDSHLLEVCRYVVLNPVRARWSKLLRPGNGAATGRRLGGRRRIPASPRDWVLGQFSGKRGKGEKEYRQFVQWGIGKSLWHEVRGQSILGEEAFADEMVDHLRKHKHIPEISKKSALCKSTGTG